VSEVYCPEEHQKREESEEVFWATWVLRDDWGVLFPISTKYRDGHLQDLGRKKNQEQKSLGAHYFVKTVTRMADDRYFKAERNKRLAFPVCGSRVFAARGMPTLSNYGTGGRLPRDRGGNSSLKLERPSKKNWPRVQMSYQLRRGRLTRLQGEITVRKNPRTHSGLQDTVKRVLAA